MKIFLFSMLLLQCLLNEAIANLDGQTDERVPLLNEDGSSTGIAITCTPHSVEHDTYDVEYEKYILDTEQEDNSTAVWNSQTNITLFQECASYASESNASMFYFDGQTCETSDTVYERKEKTCNSTAAKMVYMQKGLVPSKCFDDGKSYDVGEVWDASLSCHQDGRKRCENGGVITAERKYYDGNLSVDIYAPHKEGVDYYPITDACLIRPRVYTGVANYFAQMETCQSVGGSSCSPANLDLSNSTTFTQELKAFFDSHFVDSMNTSQLTTILSRKDSDGLFYWETYTLFDFPPTNDTSKNCIVFDAGGSHAPSGSDCEVESTRDICCMIFHNNIG